MGGGATVVDVVVEGGVVLVVVVVGAAVVLVVVGATVVVVLTVEGATGAAVVVGAAVVLVGAEPDRTNSPPQPARTMKRMVPSAMTTDGDRRRALTNPASDGNRKTPWLSLLPLASPELPKARSAGRRWSPTDTEW